MPTDPPSDETEHHHLQLGTQWLAWVSEPLQSFAAAGRDAVFLLHFLSPGVASLSIVTVWAFLTTYGNSIK